MKGNRILRLRFFAFRVLRSLANRFDPLPAIKDIRVGMSPEQRQTVLDRLLFDQTLKRQSEFDADVDHNPLPGITDTIGLESLKAAGRILTILNEKTGGYCAMSSQDQRAALAIAGVLLELAEKSR